MDSKGVVSSELRVLGTEDPRLKTDFEHPLVTVDIAVFTLQSNELSVLLVKRLLPPFKDCWALPGGFVKANEPVETAAKRELVEETGVKDVYLEQLYTFGDDVKRDPRGRVITIAYFALVDSKDLSLTASSDASDAQWFSVNRLPKLAFDHAEILGYALKRLKGKLEYTTIAFRLLPEKFTLTQLQSLYENILGREFDKRNFRKKILSLGVVEPTKEITEGVSHRPARLFKLRKKVGEFIEII